MPCAVQLLSPLLLIANLATVADVTPDGEILRRIGPAILERQNMVHLRRDPRDDAATIGAGIRVSHQDRLPQRLPLRGEIVRVVPEGPRPLSQPRGPERLGPRWHYALSHFCGASLVG